MERNPLLSDEINSLLWENNFFHDCSVEKINFSLLGNKFKLVLSDENSDIFSILMKRLFSFTYDIEYLVEEKYYNLLSWNKIFKFLRLRHLMKIDITESEYNDISLKYLNKNALKIVFDFDCGFKVKLDCLDILIEKLSPLS
jgi:hypothetical protein